MKFYLRMEGVNLANFVYDTQDLSTVRGGGLLLLDAVKIVQNASQQGAALSLSPISTGASSGLFEFEASDREAAENVRRAVDTILNKDARLRHATFVVDVQPAGSNFVADREAALARNRWRQMSQPSLAVPAQNTAPQKIVSVCEIDHVRPAMDTRHGPELEEHVSGSVKKRSEYGRERKHSFYGKLAPRAQGWQFAHNFNELAADENQGNLDRKMAVIYLDGNGFGELQHTLCTTLARQRQFDQTLKDYRASALDALLKIMSEKDGWTSSNRYRLETLLWGGDELIWVVPAWQGWKTLQLFYEKSRNWTFEGRTLTHAGGIVFCHHNAPIHRITKLAKDLAELVKTRNRENHCQENRFVYLVLESFDHVGRNLQEFMQSRYRNREDSTLLGNTMAAGEEAFHMLKFKESLPRRKLHEIVHCLQQNNRATADELIKKVTQGPNQELSNLTNYFGVGDIGWQHLLELWDYVGV